MRKVWRWLCKNSVPVQKKAVYPGDESSGGG